MFDKKIIEYLLELTDEESNALNGQTSVNKDIYTEAKDFEIDYHKFLNENEYINIRRHTRFVDFPEHKHNYIEMSYVVQGEMIQVIKGKEIHLRQGEMIFLNQHIKHQIRASKHEDIIINFIIKPEFFEYILMSMNNDNIISKFLFSTMYGGSKRGEYLCFFVGDIKAVQSTIEQVVDEMINQSIFGNAKIKFLVGLLLIELLSNPEKISSYSEENYEIKLMVEILKYIDEEYKKASLAELSDKIKQPDYRICKVIKKHTGLTFIGLIQEKRLEKALELLKTSDYTVEEIISTVGYENDSYFYRIFKKKFGKTPKEVKSNKVLG